MTQFDQNHEPLDPQLIELLEQLRPTPPRDPEAQAVSRVEFLAEVESITRNQPAHPKTLFGWLSLNHDHKEEFPVNRKRRFAFSALLALILGFVFLLGGAGATVLAAQSSLPGDALYPVKTGLEQTQATMAGDAFNQAQLYLEFAQRRLDELDRLIAEGRFRDVPQAAEAFEVYLQKAIAAFQVVAQEDPARSAELAGQVAGALSQYARVLNAIAANAPEAVRPEVERALQAALSSGQLEAGAAVEVEFTGVIETITPQVWTIAGRQVAIAPQTEIKDSLAVGDLVKVHAQMVDADTLVAREIALAAANANDNGDDGNLNANQNANVNGVDGNQNAGDLGNENANANLNDNTNLNGALPNENVNANDNQNDDDNVNANQNLNDNSNGNTNDNQNDGGNLNANQNSNDNDDDRSGSGGNDNQNGDDSDDDHNGNDSSGSGSGGDDDDDEDDDDY